MNAGANGSSQYQSRGLITIMTHEFDCTLGVRQGESLSPFLFTMYINDLEDTLHTSGVAGLTIDFLKLFLILYADNAGYVVWIKGRPAEWSKPPK